MPRRNPFKVRKPSVNRMLGISQAKAKLTKATGGRAARNPKALITNAKRRTKRQMGLEANYAQGKGRKTGKRTKKDSGCLGCPCMVLIAILGLITVTAVPLSVVLL